MSADPRVSVVVSTRNRAASLRTLLASLRAQTLPAEAFEVVVVDDASTDATPAVLDRERADAALRLRVVRRDAAGGPAKGRNAGWRAARAPLIAFTDDDCVATPSWLAAAVSLAERLPGYGIQGSTDAIPEQRPRYGAFARTIEMTYAGPWFPTCNVFYPRQVLADLGGFDDDSFPAPRGEDTDLAWRAIASGMPFAFAPDAVVHHEVRQRGPLGALRDVRGWGDSLVVYARSPELRRGVFTADLFWKRRHALFAAALAGALLPRRARALSPVLMAPYAAELRRARRGQRPAVPVEAWLAVLDVAEMAGALRGGLRHGRLML